jgi:hypothetical protein
MRLFYLFLVMSFLGRLQAQSISAVTSTVVDSSKFKKVVTPEGFSTQLNVVYAKVNDWEGRMDLYLPPTVGEPTPVIINIHGGGWNHGAKEEQGGFAPYFKAGFAVANIEYRLTGQSTAPAAIEDTRCALIYLIKNAKALHLDPNKIIAQRVGEWEARGRTPDPDSVGFIFGSQLDRDETIRQQQLRMMEEQLASISKTGIDPQTGNPVLPERLDELERGARAAKKSTKLMPGGTTLKTLGKAASILPGVGAVLDVGDVFAGTQQAMTSGSRQQQTTGALRSASGALGLASLAAPVLAPAALAVSGVSALAERRAAMPKPAQVDQIIPTPKPVMANTPTGVAQLKAMPKSKPLNLVNEAQYFIVNPIRSAYDRIFGKRDI